MHHQHEVRLIFDIISLFLDIKINRGKLKIDQNSAVITDKITNGFVFKSQFGGGVFFKSGALAHN